MMTSLDSAISGLKGSQTMMDVLGNNIANVNTPGFKSSQVNFADLLSQTMRGASQPNTTGLGGTNPIQVGQGVNVASVDTNFTTGSMQQTGVETNMGINGNGLFMLAQAPGSTNYSYTRDGDFSFDGDGNLVSNANGMYVQGVMAKDGAIPASGLASPTNITIDLNSSVPANATSSMTLSGNLNSQLNDGSLGLTESVPFVVDENGTDVNAQINFTQTALPSAANNFTSTWGYTVTGAGWAGAGTVSLDPAGNVTASHVTTVATDGTATIAPPTSGTNPNTFTLSGANCSYVTSPASQSFSSTSSSTFTATAGANSTKCNLTFTQGTAFNTWDWAITDATTGDSYGSGTITMNSDGEVTSNTGTATVPIHGVDYTVSPPAANQLPSDFTISAGGALSGIDTSFTPPTQNVVQTVYDAQGNQYSANLAFTKNSVGSWNWSVSSITDSKGNTYTIANGGVTGGSGSLSFSPSGALPADTTGTFSLVPSIVSSNGNLAAVPITIDFSALTQNDSATTAAVENQNGYAPGSLESYAIDQTGTITGSYSNGIKQVLAQIALASFPNVNGLQADGENTYSATANSGTVNYGAAGSGALGAIQSGSLEASNVDLSQEMSNMIIAQSAFDANSKVITTDDSLMQTLDNMIPV